VWFFLSPFQQVFDLLWCLVCHDIWFVWERSEFLQQAEGQMLTSKLFSVSINNKGMADKFICLSDNLLLAHESIPCWINLLWLKCAFMCPDCYKVLYSLFTFQWTPPPPPPKTPTHKTEKSMLSGFGSKSLIQTPVGSPEVKA